MILNNFIIKKLKMNQSFRTHLKFLVLDIPLIYSKFHFIASTDNFLYSLLKATQKYQKLLVRLSTQKNYTITKNIMLLLALICIFIDTSI